MRRSKAAGKPEGDAESLLLIHAADLILETGQRDVDIKELAKRSQVPRSTIYTHFGQPIRDVILARILGRFLSHAAVLITGALAGQKAASPIERLAAVFRGALAAFEADERFGKVVLDQLNLRRSEAKAVFTIFAQVDGLIAEARKAGQLSPESTGHLADWKIRQVIFVIAHGLLRALYLKEGLPVGQPAPRGASVTLSEREVEIEVLRVLQIYCGEDAAEKIQQTIDVLKAQKTT